MKKMLLMSAAIAAFSIAQAQYTHIDETHSSLKAVETNDNIVVLPSKASLTDAQRQVMTAKRLPDDGVWYKRPAGSLCFGVTNYATTTNSGWRRVMEDVLVLPAHSTIKFENASTASGTKFSEAAVKVDRKTAYPLDFEEVDGNALVHTHGRGLTQPLLVSNATNSYFFGIESPDIAQYAARFTCDSITDYGFEEIPSSTFILSQSGTANYIIGTVSDRIDFNQDGKNETVYLDGFHMFYPKPLAPFAVNRINIPIVSNSGNFFESTESLTLTIYKVKTSPNGSKSFGDVIFTTQVSDDNFPQAPGNLMVGKQAHLTVYITDDEQGYYTFDDEFAIELKGFQREGVDLGTRAVGRFTAARKDPVSSPYVYRDFVNKAGEYVGSTVWANNDWGVLVSFYGSYDVMKVDGLSNTITVSADGKTCDDEAVVYTQLSWNHSDGHALYELADLPSWVKNVKATKVESGIHELAVECEPLPAGVTGRSCEVKIKSMFGNLSDDVITITQGEGGAGLRGDINGDGVVDIADVNAGIDMVLNLQKSNSAADLNGDGVVDVADINAVIDIILE